MVFNSLAWSLQLMPAMVTPSSGEPPQIFPPGATSVSYHGDHCRVLLPGETEYLDVEGPDPTHAFGWILRRGLSKCQLMLLPDAAFPEPGEMTLPEQRHYYNAALVRLAQMVDDPLGSCIIRSSKESRTQTSSCFGRLLLPQRSYRVPGMMFYPFQGPELISHYLSSALLWFDYCRQRHHHVSDQLLLLVPENILPSISGCLRWLNPEKVIVQLISYRFSPPGIDWHADVPSAFPSFCPARFEYPIPRPLHNNPVIRALVDQYAPHLTLEQTPFSHDQICCRGLPIIRVFGPNENQILVGWSSPNIPWQYLSAMEREQWLRHIISLRTDPPPQPHHPVFRLSTERWLEHQLLTRLEHLVPTLRPDRTYRQVPAWRGGRRTIMDLLSIHHSNRLAVIEVKAVEDDGMLFQALDYWQTIEDGRRQGTLAASGYFDDLELQQKPSDLFLVTPLFRSHRNMDTLVGYLNPQIPLFLLEVNLRWRRQWRVVRKRQFFPDYD